jgi:hypothetical protein
LGISRKLCMILVEFIFIASIHKCWLTVWCRLITREIGIWESISWIFWMGSHQGNLKKCSNCISQQH